MSNSHKIAIITTRNLQTYHEDEFITIIKTITDWCIVSHDDYLLLWKAQFDYLFTIIEQPVDTPAFILKTVTEYTRIYANA